jgi:Protein of unknown function with PCYCGC motif
MNKGFLALILFTGLMLIACSKGTSHPHSAAVTTPENVKRGPSRRQPSKAARVPAHHAIAPTLDDLPPTLSPDLFAGNQRLAYKVAQEIPQTLAQLPCYCHCDMSIGHKSLHSCFVTEHGESCGICIGEALMAYQLEKQKVPVAEIRQRIIAAYGTPTNQ